jgi:hypothetical protein
MTAPPDHLVCVFPEDTIAGQEQDEFIGKVESFDMEPHAVVGNVDNEAVVRQSAGSELDLCRTVEAVAWRSSSFL